MTTLMPDQTPEGWGKAASAYDRSIVDRITATYAAEAIRTLGVQPGDRLLDVATGPGTAALAAAEAGAQVLAVDYASQMIERLRLRATAAGADIETAVMDGQALDLPDASFDLATCVFGLMFFPECARGFRELARVLRPSGRAAVVTWAAPERVPGISIWREAAVAAVPDLPPPPAPPAIFSLSDPAALAGELESAGFGGVRVVPVVRDWHFDSPESFWDELHDAAPVQVALLASLGDRTGLVRDALLSMLHDRFGDGPVVFECEALLGLGVKG